MVAHIVYLEQLARLGFGSVSSRLPFMIPSAINHLGTLHDPRLDRRRHIQIPRRILAVKLAHGRVRGFNAVVGHVGEQRTGRELVDDERLGAAQIRLDIFMNHVNLESLVNVEKVNVDVLQGFIIGDQGLDQYRFRVHGLLGQQGVRHGFEDGTPFRRIRARVRSAQEDDAVGGDEDGPEIIRRFTLHVVGEFQRLGARG